MHKRRDNTHKQMVDDLRAMHFSVWDTADLGKDFPDLVVAKDGFTVLVEVKTPRGKQQAAQRRSDGQASFAGTWRGEVIAAYTADQVVLHFYEGKDKWMRTGQTKCSDWCY